MAENNENNFTAESNRMNKNDRLESCECSYMSQENSVNSVLSSFWKLYLTKS